MSKTPTKKKKNNKKKHKKGNKNEKYPPPPKKKEIHAKKISIQGWGQNNVLHAVNVKIKFSYCIV